MRYYINKNRSNPGNNNEVHTEVCRYLPEPRNREYLGVFSNGDTAVRYAKSIGYYNADGCFYCCREAHRG